MKIISTEFGQVFQLVFMEEMRPIYPNSALVPTDFFKEIATRYQFAVVPTDFSEITKSGTAKFQHGKMSIKGFDVPIGELGIFNDGVIVITRDTRHSNAVMDDFEKWCMKKYALREPEIKVPRRFVSRVVVEFDKSIDRVVTLYEKFSRRYGEMINSLYGWDVPINLSRLAFGTDPALMRPHTDTNFLIERRLEISWERNRWFCSAPLPTETHVEYLELCEKLATG